ncbi:MAG: ABC transporter ATP-binding protein [Planctomycetes bacterium]|nr:ABC transporter ATP-binding protein [Planctomycetota bacterium]
MAEAVISTNDLAKRYGAVAALDGVSLELARGEIVGFVGPNGAGKSTFMKLLLGIARPSAGAARVLGLDMIRGSEAIRRRVGYLPGDLGLYRNLRAGAFLAFCLSFYRDAPRGRGAELARLFELPLEQKIKGYSTGMRQKLGLVQALAAGAELLILDEPTKGLDPTSQALFADLLAEEQAEGRSVLLSSHVLEEVERMCHRIEFLDRGRIIPPDVVAAVREDFRRVLSATFRAGREPDLAAIPNVQDVRREKDRFLLRIDGEIGPALAALARMDVDSLEFNRPDLQEIYHAVYLSRRRS